MKAIVVGTDKKLVLNEVENPVMKAGEVMLEIRACALNRADLLQRAGSYPPPAGWPDLFGLEAAGVITEVSEEVKKDGKWKVGDTVCALLGSGGYAEYINVPSELLMPIPKGFTFEQAACLPEVYGAGYLFLCYEGKIKSGETLLITAGASGLASAVIPMAKAFGARVITTVQNAEMAKKIEYLNADIVVDTSCQSLLDVLKAQSEVGRGVDVCIDCLGGKDVGECMPYMNFDGRWIMIATLENDFTNVNMRSMYAKRLRLIGTNLRSRTNAQKKQLLGEMAEILWPKMESGEVKPTIYKIFPIEEAEEAQALMASGTSAGKIVLKVKE